MTLAVAPHFWGNRSHTQVINWPFLTQVTPHSLGLLVVSGFPLGRWVNRKQVQLDHQKRPRLCTFFIRQWLKPVAETAAIAAQQISKKPLSKIQVVHTGFLSSIHVHIFTQHIFKNET